MIQPNRAEQVHIYKTVPSVIRERRMVKFPQSYSDEDAAIETLEELHLKVSEVIAPHQAAADQAAADEEAAEQAGDVQVATEAALRKLVAMRLLLESMLGLSDRALSEQKGIAEAGTAGEKAVARLVVEMIEAERAEIRETFDEVLEAERSAKRATGKEPATDKRPGIVATMMSGVAAEATTTTVRGFFFCIHDEDIAMAIIIPWMIL